MSNSTSIDTDPFSGSYHGDSSSTTGFHGHITTEPNGDQLIVGGETLMAKRKDEGDLGHLNATQRRTKIKGVTTVEQDNYAYRARKLPDVELREAAPPDFAAAAETGVGTCFGKFDSDDGGTGSPVMKIVQTNSEVFGASLREARLKQLFGAKYATNPKRLTSFVEVVLPKTGRFARVPLVDVGPGEPGVDVDLTIAVVKHLVNDPSQSDKKLAKTFKTKVKFRAVVV